MTTIAPPPQPPAGPPPALSPRGRTAVRVTLVAAAAVLLVGAVAGLGVAAWGVSNVRVVSDTVALPGTVRTLVVATGDIPVAIRLTSGPDTAEASVSLRLAHTAGSGTHRLAVAGSGGETRVGIEGHASGMLEWARGGEITVTLPPEQARRLTVRTEQQTGVLIAQTDVDQLSARTANGAVVLHAGARRVDIRTIDGEIRTRGPVSVTERFSATTADGDIDVDFTGVPPREVEAISRDGDVAIGLPGDGPYLVNAQAGATTRVRVPEATGTERAVSEVTARSDNGDVVVQSTSNRHR